MDRDVVFDVVSDLDENCITFSGVESRPRKPAIDGDNGLCRAQPTGVPHHHLHRLPTKTSEFNVVRWRD